MSENFKRITGSKGFFISDIGEVFRKKQNYEFKRIASFENSVTGYIHTNVQMRNGSWKGFTIHKLVAAAFLKKPRYMRNLEINHINGNKADNRVSNLQFLTHQENQSHAWAIGLCKKIAPAIRKKRAELGGQRTELTHDDVRQIRRLRKSGFKLKQLAYIYNLHPINICNLCNRRTWKNVD